MYKLTRTLVACLFAAACTPSNEHREFRSWYDGWGTHKVWGLGIVKAPHDHGLVTCGDSTFKVTPVYDVHSDTEPPNTEQAGEFLMKLNLALAAELENQGVKCTFEDDPRGNESWLAAAAKRKAH